MTNDDTSPSPSDSDDGTSTSPSTADHRGNPAFLGRPDAGEDRVEFIRRVIEALLGKDDPRVKKWLASSTAESEEKR